MQYITSHLPGLNIGYCSPYRRYTLPEAHRIVYKMRGHCAAKISTSFDMAQGTRVPQFWLLDALAGKFYLKSCSYYISPSNNPNLYDNASNRIHSVPHSKSRAQYSESINKYGNIQQKHVTSLPSPSTTGNRRYFVSSNNLIIKVQQLNWFSDFCCRDNVS